MLVQRFLPLVHISTLGTTELGGGHLLGNLLIQKQNNTPQESIAQDKSKRNNTAKEMISQDKIKRNNAPKEMISQDKISELPCELHQNKTGSRGG